MKKLIILRGKNYNEKAVLIPSSFILYFVRKKREKTKPTVAKADKSSKEYGKFSEHFWNFALFKYNQFKCVCDFISIDP